MTQFFSYFFLQKSGKHTFPLVLSQQYFNCFIVEWYFRFHIHILFINYKLWLFFFIRHSMRGTVFPLQNDPFESFNKKYMRILPEIGKTNRNNKYFIQSTTFHKGIFLLHILYTYEWKGGKNEWIFQSGVRLINRNKNVYFQFVRTAYRWKWINMQIDAFLYSNLIFFCSVFPAAYDE